MSVTSWFRRLFGPSRVGDGDTLAPSAPDEMVGAPGVSAYAGLENAAAVEDIQESTEPPADPTEF